MRQVGKAYGWPIPQNDTLFPTLFFCTQQTYQTLDDLQCLEKVGRRMTNDADADYSATEVLMEVDEAAKCLEKDDEQRFVKESARCAETSEIRQAFQKDWTTKRADLQSAQSAAKGKKGQGKGKKKGASKSSSTRTLPDTMQMMEQSEAKQWMPTGKGICLWKSRGDGSWHSVVPPFPETSRRVGTHGAEALKMVISQAWKNWCFKEGVPLDACPMLGLVSAD